VADGYDSYLVKAGLAGTKKFRRLSTQEAWCAVMGVWSIAAQSPVRGYLFLTEDEPATEQDYADEARVSVAIARSTVKKMRVLHMIEMDEEMGVEYVHDWHKHQKDPKPSESREAWAARKREQRANSKPVSRAGHADVPRDIGPSPAPGAEKSHTPLREGKGREGKLIPPPDPPKGGRKKDHDVWAEQMAAWLVEHPVTDELTALVDPIVAAFVKSDPNTAMSLNDLHGHLDGTELVLGAKSAQVGWLRERFGKALSEVAGKPVRILDCGCKRTLTERAA
jgi:N-terminal phage replisome organiser (Phage_rep_org_N)